MFLRLDFSQISWEHVKNVSKGMALLGKHFPDIRQGSNMGSRWGLSRSRKMSPNPAYWDTENELFWVYFGEAEKDPFNRVKSLSRLNNLKTNLLYTLHFKGRIVTITQVYNEDFSSFGKISIGCLVVTTQVTNGHEFADQWCISLEMDSVTKLCLILASRLLCSI